MDHKTDPRPELFFSRSLEFFLCNIAAVLKELLPSENDADKNNWSNIVRGAKVLCQEPQDFCDASRFRDIIDAALSFASSSKPSNRLDLVYTASLLLSNIHSKPSIASAFSAASQELLASNVEEINGQQDRRHPNPTDYELMMLFAEMWLLQQLPQPLARLEEYCQSQLSRISDKKIDDFHRFIGFFSLLPAPMPQIADDILLQHLFRSNFLRSAIAYDPWRFFEQICLYLILRPNQTAFQFLSVILQREIEGYIAASRYIESRAKLDDLIHIARVLLLYQQAKKTVSNPVQSYSHPRAKPIWDTASVAAITDGQLVPENAPAISLSMGTYIADQIRPGSLFIAPDDHWGKKYHQRKADQSALLARGATALVSSDQHQRNVGILPVIMVRNTFTAMLKLALENRRRYPGKIISITGSVGKTSTSTMLHELLSRFYPTYKNLHYFNHQTGVPKSIANIPLSSSFAIIEMGMGQPGTILPKSLLARPHVAVVTEIQHDHMEFHPSIDSIINTKMEIVEGLLPKGVIILNRDSEYFANMLGILKARKPRIRHLTFGEHPLADIRALAVDLHPDYSDLEVLVAGEKWRYRLSMPGKHMALNSLAAISVCFALHLDIETFLPVFNELHPASGRNEILNITLPRGRRVQVIDDSFNANPASMRSSFHLLSLMQPKGQGRRIMVAGDMGELGENTKAYHQSLANDVNHSRINIFYSIGEYMRYLNTEIKPHIIHNHFTSWEELSRVLQTSLCDGDILCFKGSARQGIIQKILQSLSD